MLSFESFTRIGEFKGGWINHQIELNEGISFIGGENPSIEIDYSNDLQSDVVKLNPPLNLRPTRKAGIPVYAGYKTDKRANNLGQFLKYVKEWEAIDDSELDALIDFTYPKELKDMFVNTIFVVGSSKPLASRIADSLVKQYYPKAKVIDIIKAYYGVDVNSMVDWDEYKKADDTTKKEIDTFLNTRRERGDFEGYIKKSSGLRSGSRRLLKPGHMIDDYITSTITSDYKEFAEVISKHGKDFRVVTAARPKYLIVDDTIIEGSTLGSIFEKYKDAINKLTDVNAVKYAITSTFGYCLFSHGSRHKPFD